MERGQAFLCKRHVSPQSRFAWGLDRGDGNGFGISKPRSSCLFQVLAESDESHASACAAVVSFFL